MTATIRTFAFGSRTVNRMGYGAMQLAGKGVFGPPRDRDEAVAVLREAIASGVDHIDTSDFYGPHITNQIIREALHPYPAGLALVTKVGARRGSDGAWIEASSPSELVAAVHDNLRNLGVEQLHAVNFRAMFDVHGPAEGSIASQIEALARLKEQGLLRHVGISNATPTQVAEARGVTDIACVQNQYNLAHRHNDDLIDALAADGIAYVPFFPLGGFSPLQSTVLSEVAATLGISPLQTALAWLMRRASNILLIPGTSSRAHLRENLAAADVDLDDAVLARLDSIAGAARSDPAPH